MKIKSMRGKPVDFNRLLAQHGDMPAVGNASMNARGDLIDKQGNVLRTRADISAEYHRNNANAVKHVPIRATETLFQTPAEAVKQAMAQQSVKAAEDKPAARSRKISEEE